MVLPRVSRLVYRNFKVNTDPASLVILVGLPAMYLVFFGFGFGDLLFIAPGLMAFQSVMAGTVGGGMLWADRRYGMLAQLLVGPFSRLDYLLGIMLTTVIFGLAGAVVMYAVAFALLHGVYISPLGWGSVVVTITVGSLFFGALMLILSALVKSNNTYNSIQILVLFFINFASTVFYPNTPRLPVILQVLFRVNPLSYIANLVRAGFDGTLVPVDLFYLIGLLTGTVILVVLATRTYMRSDISYT